MTVTTRAAAGRSNSPQSTTSQTPPRQDSPAKSNGSPSDEEGRGVRPTRRKLAKTSIDGPISSEPLEEAQSRKSIDSFSETGSAVGEDSSTKSNGARGRLRRKRSFEDVGEDHGSEKISDKTAKHQRKRSREAGKNGVEADNESDVSASDGSESPGTEEETLLSIGDTTVTSTESAVLPNPKLSNVPGSKNIADFQPDEAAVVKADEVVHEDKGMEKSERGVKHAIAGPEAYVNGEAVLHSGDKSEAHNFKVPDVPKKPDKASTKIVPSSGFANASAQSPFGVLGASKGSTSTSVLTSPSAFAGSGFAALAGQSQSPFGSLAAKSPQSTKADKDSLTLGATERNGFAALADAGGASPFAAITGGQASVFGARAGFSTVGSGLVTGAGFGGGFGKPLATFATPEIGSFGMSNKSIKAFGALADDGEEADGSGGDDDDLEAGADFSGEDQKDDRFYKQELATGEENESTVFKGRGKLYMMGADKAWKERGTGDFKVNSRVETSDKDDEKSERITARFLMRVDGSHRVVLNSPITKDIKVEDPSRGPPKGKSAVFLGWVDGELVTLQLKMRDNIQTSALHDAVCKVQALL